MAIQSWERGVLIDITEQKQAQELFQLATEASPSGIILVSDRGHDRVGELAC